MRFHLRSPFAYRRLVRAIERIGDALETQNAALIRLAEAIAPALPAEGPVEESVSFVDEQDTIVALDYIQRTHARTGHTPTDEEVVAYLAEEKTQALQSRLNEREELLAALRGGTQ